MGRAWLIPLPVLAAATALLLPAAAPAATACPGADGDPAQLGHDATVAALLCLTNHERMAAGLPALRPDDRLALAAQRHAQDMVARGYFSHDAPAPAPFGAKPAQRIEAAGFQWSALGENIAAGQQTPRWVMRDWLASAGHCQNIMWTQVTAVGFGVATESVGDYPAPAWVQELGRPAGTSGSDDGDPACPRSPATPAPVDGPAPADERAPWVTAASTPPDDRSATRVPLPQLDASARRTGRTLRLRITVPAANASRVRLSVRVRQRGRDGRALSLRRRAGAHRLSLRLARAAGGAVTVRVGHARRTVAFG